MNDDPNQPASLDAQPLQSQPVTPVAPPVVTPEPQPTVYNLTPTAAATPIVEPAPTTPTSPMVEPAVQQPVATPTPMATPASATNQPTGQPEAVTANYSISRGKLKPGMVICIVVAVLVIVGSIVAAIFIIPSLTN
jgi:hypothetical protein